MSIVPAKEAFAPRPKWARAKKAAAPIAWERSITLGLANLHCSDCKGLGQVARQRPCKCVLRAVFRACLARYREFRGHSCGISSVNCTRLEQGRTNSYVFGRKVEEFFADFELIAWRGLTARQWRIFERHYLRDIPLSRASRTVYHQAYAIEHKLGRAFAEERPYALYPIDEYMGQTIRRAIVDEKRMAA